MPWYDPEDHSMPVISPPEQIRSKYPNMRIPVLPARAVVFCMGRGLTVSMLATGLRTGICPLS